MYFESRTKAGQILATNLLNEYRYESCAVVALSNGSVAVGEQIALSLHCVLMLLLTEDIPVPGEGLNFGSISQEGDFIYNNAFSEGEIEEYGSEFHGYLEEQKREAFQRMNRLIGDGGVIDRNLLSGHVVILVSDGIDSSSSIDVALDFLKPITIKKLVVASPTASLQVVDRLHVVADELHILDVKGNYMGTNHYYEKNDIPSREETIAKINQIILNWR